jgi:putative hydrolase of the HAD superfamily
MSEIKAVLFDFDHTLGRRPDYAYACYKHILEESVTFDDPIEEEAVLQEMMIWDQQGDVNKNYIKEKLADMLDIHLPYDDLDKYWDEHLWEYTVLMPHCEEVLTYLNRKYIIGLISNGKSWGQRMKVKQGGLERFFPEERTAVSGDYDVRKPDPRFFQKACEKFGVKPAECVYVGDLFYRDVLGAYRAGMKPVWITETDVPYTADVTIIHDLIELENFL